MINRIMVFNYKHTVMNGTSPRQIPVHILMSLANKYSCNLAMIQCGLGDYGKVEYRLDHFFFFLLFYSNIG